MLWQVPSTQVEHPLLYEVVCILHALRVVQVQGINQTEEKTEGLRQVSQLHHHSPFYDDPKSGWVEVRIDAEDSHWCLTEGDLTYILTQRETNGQGQDIIIPIGSVHYMYCTCSETLHQILYGSVTWHLRNRL